LELIEKGELFFLRSSHMLKIWPLHCAGRHVSVCEMYLDSLCHSVEKQLIVIDKHVDSRNAVWLRWWAYNDAYTHSEAVTTKPPQDVLCILIYCWWYRSVRVQFVWCKQTQWYSSTPLTSLIVVSGLPDTAAVATHPVLLTD